MDFDIVLGHIVSLTSRCLRFMDLSQVWVSGVCL